MTLKFKTGFYAVVADTYWPVHPVISNTLISLLISKRWPKGEGEGEIRTSDLRFMRRGPQLIVLPLGISYLMASYLRH